MKKFLRSLFWQIMGYTSGPPVNISDLNRVMGDWYNRINEESNKRSIEQQARIVEYITKLLSEDKDKVVNVRLVK